jgi:transposase-like protein
MVRTRSAELVAQWRERLQRYRESGLTVVEFCRREGVSAPSFYQWRKRLDGESPQVRDGRSERAGDAVVGDSGPFMAVRLASPLMAEVEFPNGLRIRVPATSDEALQAAVRAGCDHCREAQRC